MTFWRGEGNAATKWDELRREVQKEQALRSDSGLKGKDCRWGRVHRNNMCLNYIMLPIIHLLLGNSNMSAGHFRISMHNL